MFRTAPTHWHSKNKDHHHVRINMRRPKSNGPRYNQRIRRYSRGEKCVKVRGTAMRRAKSGHSMDGKPNLSMALEKIHKPTTKRRSPTFLTLPLDIKIVIFSYLLPHHRRIIHLTGSDKRLPTCGALSRTCRLLNHQLRHWFNSNQRLQRQYTKTLQYGLISRDTHFALRITPAFRDVEHCAVDETAAAGSSSRALIPECTCCTKFLRVLASPDFGCIRSLVLHFMSEDQPGRRDNLGAIKRLPHLPALRNLDFLLGDRRDCWGENWRGNRDWDGDGGKREARIWIPTSRMLVAVLKARRAFPETIFIHVWLVVGAEDEEWKEKIELLCSWPPEGEGGGHSYSVAELSSGMAVD